MKELDSEHCQNRILPLQDTPFSWTHTGALKRWVWVRGMIQNRKILMKLLSWTLSGCWGLCYRNILMGKNLSFTSSNLENVLCLSFLVAHKILVRTVKLMPAMIITICLPHTALQPPPEGCGMWSELYRRLRRPFPAGPRSSGLPQFLFPVCFLILFSFLGVSWCWPNIHLLTENHSHFFLYE